MTPKSREEAAPTDLVADQVLAVMDRLAAMEATWHAGQPLAQTLYTCFYMIDPSRCAQLPTIVGTCRDGRTTS